MRIIAIVENDELDPLDQTALADALSEAAARFLTENDACERPVEVQLTYASWFERHRINKTQESQEPARRERVLVGVWRQAKTEHKGLVKKVVTKVNDKPVQSYKPHSLHMRRALTWTIDHWKPGEELTLEEFDRRIRAVWTDETNAIRTIEQLKRLRLVEGPTGGRFAKVWMRAAVEIRECKE